MERTIFLIVHWPISAESKSIRAFEARPDAERWCRVARQVAALSGHADEYEIREISLEADSRQE